MPIEMTTRAANEVNRLQGHALWYAWGREDAGTRLPEGKSADGFRMYYKSLAEDFACERTYSRPSITDAYRDYQRAVSLAKAV